MIHGYSKTPLVKKLGIKPYYSILLYNEPKHYFELLGDLPEHTNIHKSIIKDAMDFIHLFFKTERGLVELSILYKDALKQSGMLWVSWPKGASKLETDLNRELVRHHLLSIGLVDIKVAAIDEDWSGLKFVYRLKDRD